MGSVPAGGCGGTAAWDETACAAAGCADGADAGLRVELRHRVRWSIGDRRRDRGEVGEDSDWSWVASVSEASTLPRKLREPEGGTGDGFGAAVAGGGSRLVVRATDMDRRRCDRYWLRHDHMDCRDRGRH